MQKSEENLSNHTNELAINLKLTLSDANTSILTETISRTSLLPIFDGSILRKRKLIFEKTRQIPRTK